MKTKITILFNRTARSLEVPTMLLSVLCIWSVTAFAEVQVPRQAAEVVEPTGVAKGEPKEISVKDKPKYIAVSLEEVEAYHNYKDAKSHVHGRPRGLGLFVGPEFIDWILEQRQKKGAQVSAKEKKE